MFIRSLLMSQNDKYKVSVNFEWGKLKDVIVGIGDNITMPTHGPKLKSLQTRLEPYDKKHAGQKLADFNPKLYHKLIEQINYFANLLKQLNINVHRCINLTKEEKEYLANIQGGYELLYPRDIIIVIGNNIIEASIKLPFRRKDIFSVRPLIIPYLKNSRNKYVAVPNPSPTLLDKKNIFLEGGDVLLHGKDIYVGSSGLASNNAGINWLKNYLGTNYNVHKIPLHKHVLHLDIALSLIRPGLGIKCQKYLLNDLPKSLSKFDFIEITEEETNNLSGNVIIIDQNTIMVEKQNSRLIKELRKRKIEVIPISFKAVTLYGGGFRCSHHPLRRDD